MLGMIGNILIIAVIAVKAFLAMGRGFFRSFVKFAGYLIQLFLASVFYSPLATWLNAEFNLSGMMTDMVKKWFGEVVLSESSSTVAGGIGVPDALEDIINPIVSSIDPLSAVNARSIAISNLLINVLAFTIIIVVSGIVLSVVASILDKVCEVPLLKQISDLAALVLGALDGYLVVCVILILNGIISPRFDFELISVMVNTSFVGAFIQDNNIILYLIGKIMAC